MMSKSRMKVRYHLPTYVQFHNETSEEEKARLERALVAAIRRAVESASTASAEIVTGNGAEAQEDARERFSFVHFRPERGTYSVPSYDDGGASTEVPIEEITPDIEPAVEAEPGVPPATELHAISAVGEILEEFKGRRNKARILSLISAAKRSLHDQFDEVRWYEASGRSPWFPIGDPGTAYKHLFIIEHFVETDHWDLAEKSARQELLPALIRAGIDIGEVSLTDELVGALRVVDKMKFALKYSLPHWPGGIGEAAKEFFTDPLAVGILVATIVVFAALAFVPEPTGITKAAVILLSAVLIATFGYATIKGAFEAIKNFYNRCDRAKTVRELEEAGRLLAEEGGEPLFNILLFIVMWRGGKAIGRRIGKIRAERAAARGEPPPEGVRPFTELERLVSKGEAEGLNEVTRFGKSVEAALNSEIPKVDATLPKGKPNWARALLKRVTGELNGPIARMRAGEDAITPERVQGTYNNLRAVWNEFVIRSSFPDYLGTSKINYGDGLEVEVDVVFRGGRAWAEVKNTKSFGLRSRAWTDPKDGLDVQSAGLAEAAKEHGVELYIRFTRGVGADVARVLKSRGFTVEGEIVIFPEPKVVPPAQEEEERR